MSRRTPEHSGCNVRVHAIAFVKGRIAEHGVYGSSELLQRITGMKLHDIRQTIQCKRLPRTAQRQERIIDKMQRRLRLFPAGENPQRAIAAAQIQYRFGIF